MKEQAERRLTLAWQRSDALFNIVRRESILRQPIPWRHPFIFYVGHLPAFAWNQICRGVLGREPLNSRFDELFSRGIDPDLDSGICHDHPDVPEQWPDLDEVLEYRDRARTAVLNSIEDVPRAARRDIMALNGRVLTMVLEHECMHQETFLYMVQELWAEEKNPPPDLPEHVLGKSIAPAEVEIPDGEAKLGASFDSLDFGWDNEFPERRARVPCFRIDVTPVTNGQFLDFVESGAYANPAYWRRGDWLWKSKFGVRHPHFWIKREGQWFYRTLFDFLKLESVLSWPVYVSLAEALAYARWKGKRLPTEAE
ncbi:MAG: SUMF1/EgtB/PvdO family nonheme iron enzyme, partial [Candidatus Binatia bacterium]